MIRSFADAAAADIFRDRNTKAARRIPRDLWRIAQRKLKMLDAAARIEDLESPPANRLKALKGALRGRHSIRLNDPYRVTFRWEEGHAFEVAVEDYHEGSPMARAGDRSRRDSARGISEAAPAGPG
jgi:proteic killer suppression protein